MSVCSVAAHGAIGQAASHQTTDIMRFPIYATAPLGFAFVALGSINNKEPLAWRTDHITY